MVENFKELFLIVIQYWVLIYFYRKVDISWFLITQMLMFGQKLYNFKVKTLIYHLNDPSKYFSLSGRGPSGNIQGIHI